MRIICLSDTHSLHKKMSYNIESFIDPKQENILIHAGDITNVGKEYDVASFIYWLQNLKGFDDKIFIAGNHDLSFEVKPSWLNRYINEENLSQSDCVYLEDSEYIIEYPEFSKPIKVYGTPWQPEFMNWAFNLPRKGKELKEKWDMIPNDVDILITHGPPYGINDKIEGRDDSLGCEILYDRVMMVKPKIHIFGHIHSGNNIVEKDGIVFINASICTEDYKPTYKPIVIDYDFNDNKWLLINS